MQRSQRPQDVDARLRQADLFVGLSKGSVFQGFSGLHRSSRERDLVCVVPQIFRTQREKHVRFAIEGIEQQQSGTEAMIVGDVPGNPSAPRRRREAQLSFQTRKISLQPPEEAFFPWTYRAHLHAAYRGSGGAASEQGPLIPRLRRGLKTGCVQFETGLVEPEPSTGNPESLQE